MVAIVLRPVLIGSELSWDVTWVKMSLALGFECWVTMHGELATRTVISIALYLSNYS